jgi:DNA-binding NarL/FixJ family response regulator
VSVRVVLADDQTLVRSGFGLLLERADGIEVVGEASDGAEALERVRSTNPDVVLMDIRMPGMDGLEATRRIASDSRLTGVRVIILTTFDHDEYVFQALHAGASGFLLKPSITRRLIAEYVSQPGRRRHAPAELSELTDRELEVLGLVAAGLSNDEIAERLVISPATAKTHVSRILLKLGARDRAQLVVMAYETGLVTARSTTERKS